MKDINLMTDVALAYSEIIATPYYQDGGVYKHAKHLITEDEQSSFSEMKRKVEELESSQPPVTAVRNGEQLDPDEALSESYKAIQRTLRYLGEIEIPKKDFEAWVLQRIQTEDIVAYAQMLNDLFAELVMIAYTYGHWQAPEVYTESDRFEGRIFDGSDAMDVIDYTKLAEQKNERKSNESAERVLNHNNPFADISIKNQKFIYASDFNRFNALELRTSRNITKVDKDENQSFIALQPGFNIRNSIEIENGGESNIRFDDTLTSEMTQDDDNTYVYLDVTGISS